MSEQDARVVDMKAQRIFIAGFAWPFSGSFRIWTHSSQASLARPWTSSLNSTAASSSA
jgi:hypothetical protein